MTRTRIRLLFVTAEPWPTFRADVAVLFGKWLPRFGVQSELVAIGSADGVPAPAWGGGGMQVRPVAGGQFRRRITTMLHGLRRVIAASAVDHDAIQVRDMPVLAALALPLARFKRLPFFYWMSYPMPEGQIELARQRGLSAGLMKFLYPWISGRVGRLLLYRVVLRLADHVFVQSARMAQDLAQLGVPMRKMTAVPMGVDFESVDIDAVPPASDPRIEGRRALVYLGSLDRPRQIELLFDMLALLRRGVPGVMLILAGDTEDDVHRAWLKAYAAEKGVDADIVWTGWLPTQEAWRYLRRAEIGLSPFPRGFLLDSASPTKVPEYLMFKLPVVCNDNPDQAELIAASGAGRCVPYTAAAFAAAVHDLLALDCAARVTLGEAGRAHVARARNYRLIAAELAQRYGTLLGRGTSDGASPEAEPTTPSFQDER